MPEQEHKVAHTCEGTFYSGSWFRPHICGVKASVERDGRWFCKRHDPVARAEKRAKRDAEYDKKYAAERKRRQLEQTAPDLLAALQAILECADTYDMQADFPEPIAQARAAISRATT